jgi:DNA-binding PadR family transcriptional regulator
MITGNLKYIVLKLLTKKPLSGYGIMKEIKESTGGWKPSTGSIYPLLDFMLKKELLTVKKVERSKLYELTDLGKEELNILSQKREDMIDHMISELKLFSSLSERDDAMLIAEVLEDIKKDKPQFKEIHQELTDLKILFLKMHKERLINKNQREIRRILHNTIRDLRLLQ